MFEKVALMEKWFVRRRKSKVLELADKQIILATDTVVDLRNAIAAVTKGDVKEAENQIKHLSKIEHEIDELRRTIFEELTKDAIAPQDREDILHLVKRLDVMADHVKDSARNLDLLLETKIPQELWNHLENMANKLVECAKTLRKAIEALGSNPSESRKLAIKVDQIEGEIDEGYQKIKKILLQYSQNISAVALLYLLYIAEEIEHTADACDDTADYVRILATIREF
jgi:predicted phosphate transport protein (TIGR00153 family)